MATRVLAFYTLCILLCSLHGVVNATTSIYKNPLHLTYYNHEIQSGPNATLLAAAGTGQGNLSAAGWGTFIVFDNLMKAGSASDSLLLGSITGTLVLTTSATSPRAALITGQHIFRQGSEYNGSSLTLIGNILTPTPPYEVIVAGGTGLLRGYSGYGSMSPVTEAAVPPLFVFKWDIHITYKE